MQTDDAGPSPETLPPLQSPEDQTKEGTKDQMIPEYLLDWYENEFTPQMVNGSNIRPEVMKHNLTVLRDAIQAYRSAHVEIRPCSHPDENRRAWAVIPNLGLQWCSLCGAIHFNDRWIVTTNKLVDTDNTAELERLHDNALMRRERIGAELVRPAEINIDARHAVIHQSGDQQKTRQARCGNCGARYEITDDPIENHHRAMQHKTDCGRGQAEYTQEQNASLLGEFHNQEMQRLFRDRAAAALDAGADPEQLRLTGVNILDKGNPTNQPRQIGPSYVGLSPFEPITVTWPDGSPVKTPTGPLTYSETRKKQHRGLVAAVREAWRYWFQ